MTSSRQRRVRLHDRVREERVTRFLRDTSPEETSVVTLRLGSGDRAITATLIDSATTQDFVSLRR